MKTLLKGGTVVSATGMAPADILIQGEKILAVGPGLFCEDAQVISAEGKLIFPGLIDAHTHFDLDVCDTTTADDFYTGSRSALRGGTTTVIDFACPNKGESLQYGLDLWHEKAAGKTACDYGFHMTIDDWNEKIAGELPRMFDQGVTSFKMYMTYPAMMLGDRDLFLALEKMKELGGVVGVHCENSGIIDALIAKEKAAGRLGPEAHPLSRPAEAEAEAVSRLLKMGALLDLPLVIVHLSSSAGLSEVRAARARGQKVYVETCPQYLLFEDSKYSLPDFGGAKYVCAPPLRKREDNDELWRALAAGEIQTVSTDHCSFTLAQKAAGRGDFTKIPGGLPGAGTRGISMYAYGVAAGRITAPKMAEALAENPAKLYGLYPRKGVIAPGSDADLLILNPRGTTKITAEDSLSAADYSPLEGAELPGSIEAVYLRGRPAVLEGRLCTGPRGQFLPREKGAL